MPRWFTVTLTGALVFVGTTGLSGIALLIVHAYQPLAVFGLATSAAVGSAVVVSKASERDSAASHRPAIAAVGVALVFLAMTGLLHSEHLLTDRDPGVYINIGRSIAGRHTLTPVVRSGPFNNPEFVVSSQGFFQRAGKQDTWFLPMLPVLLALGWSAGAMQGCSPSCPCSARSGCSSATHCARNSSAPAGLFSCRHYSRSIHCKPGSRATLIRNWWYRSLRSAESGCT